MTSEKTNSDLSSGLTIDKKEDIVKELIPWYLEREKQTVTTLEIALSAQNFQVIEILGDQLYSHGETFGFPFISVLGKRIEIAAIDKNIELLSELIYSLKYYLEDISIVCKNINTDFNLPK